MAFRFQLGKQRSVSIVIKDHVIRFAETKNLPEIQVQKWEERYLPAGVIKEGKILDHETLTTILDECVSSWKLKNRTVSFLVPDQYIVLRKLKVPADVKKDEIRGYLYMELGTSIHLPFEDPVFDFHLLPEGDGSQNEILLFAAPEDIVKDYTEILEQVKLKPIAADVSSLALYRLYHYLDLAKTNENLLLIQFDITTVNVSIFENHQPVFMRHLMMDIDPEKWEYSKQEKSVGKTLVYSGDRTEVLLSLKDIYGEIDKVLNFYRYSLNQGKQQITNIYLDGDHPWLADISVEMKERIEVPVFQLDNSRLHSTEETHNLSSFHLNIGLGLKEV
ncbi:pilus assembly protein PilM [Bacillus sp. FJAT-29790]|uniref:type IV pilus biogenesis protein PilM n=1 Tax=Bacillus sp. FJAT-29790 TaxID=1895002 RepID=UPI001C2476DC|nr:pilus assembly protein PilM [Bacillus sp. FJAT-29790]MBU8879564.1 pilus assembly protein PilM [Bacillus sp. FJAT-29790]